MKTLYLLSMKGNTQSKKLHNQPQLASSSHHLNIIMYIM